MLQSGRIESRLCTCDLVQITMQSTYRIQKNWQQKLFLMEVSVLNHQRVSPSLHLAEELPLRKLFLSLATVGTRAGGKLGSSSPLFPSLCPSFLLYGGLEGREGHGRGLSHLAQSSHSCLDTGQHQAVTRLWEIKPQ